MDFTNCKESGEKLLELFSYPIFQKEELESRFEKIEFMGLISGETGGQFDDIIMNTISKT